MKTIFWSWQSDVSARETRDVIRAALSSAIEQLAASFEEADRPELDHDTRDVPGSPEIAATILQKIDAATAFVADITPIGVSEGGKQLANPNVLIELGYAKKSLGTSRVILVWNSAIHGSRPEDLPFDLRHRRGPISYELAIAAGKAELRSVREQLTSQFVDRLGSVLAAVPPEPDPKTEWAPSDLDSDIWIGNEARLPVNHGVSGSSQINLEPGPLGFARVIPARWQMREDAVGILEHSTQHPIPLGRVSSMNWGPTTGGFLVFRATDMTEESGVTTTATRWFRETGELWGIDTEFLRSESGFRTYAELYSAERWLAWLKQNVSLCSILGGQPPFSVRLGINELRGARWAWSHPVGAIPQALEMQVSYEFQLASSDEVEIRGRLREMLNKVRVAFGIASLSQADFDNLPTLGWN